MKLKHELKYGSAELEERPWRGFAIYSRSNWSLKFHLE
jgi:hypothetical protein